MSETMRPQGESTPQAAPAPPAVDPAELAREVERLRKQVGYLGACLVKANAEREKVARELAEVRRESEIYRHAGQNLMAKDDWTMTREDLEAEMRDAVPGDQVLAEVEEIIREARKAKEARNG